MAQQAKKKVSNWALGGRPVHMHGYGYGYSYPSLLMTLAIPGWNQARRAKAEKQLLALFDDAQGLERISFTSPDAPEDNDQATLGWFLALCDHLNALAGLQIVQPSRMLFQAVKGHRLAIPCLPRGLPPMERLVDIMLGCFNAKNDAEREALREIARAEILQLKGSNLFTSNTPRLAKAAVQQGIAFQELNPTSLVQYGIGRRAVLFDSTFTQFTPNLSARLARQKFEGAAIMRRNRLPVPQMGMASTVEQAIEVADRIGYPVVTKPADKDGGIAVQADLRNKTELKRGFKLAKEKSDRVLVEKFVPGQDYRLTVFRGRVVWAIERQPGGVTGDGKSSIEDLVEAVNADPRRGEGQHAGLKKLSLDKEALELLKRDKLKPDSVPEDGQFVRLRRASNIGRGGTPMPVLDRVHPDNARLAVRAAQALRLDLAGVDLLVPDISVSWKESGGSICEVNGQPELGITATEIYGQILREVLGGDGHIPVIAILGSEGAEQLAKGLTADLQKQGIRVGLHCRDGIYVAGEQIEDGHVAQIAAGRMLSINPAADVMILGALDRSVLHQGMPVPKADLLVITGEDIGQAGSKDSLEQSVLMLEVLRLVMQNTRHAILPNAARGKESIAANALAMLGCKPGFEDRGRLVEIITGLHQSLLPKARQRPARVQQKQPAD
jgi:cyanophycin synthetase